MGKVFSSMTPVKLSIGIPVHNEEQNIGKLLEVLLKQNLKDIELSEIIVILDGCTDSSKGVIDSVMKSDLLLRSKVKLIENEVRQGKPKTLNQIKKLSAGTYLLLLDADVIPLNSDFLLTLVSESIGSDLVACRIDPVSSGYFLTKLINFSHNLKYDLFESLYPEKGVYLCHGRSLLISSKLYSRYEYPDDVLADDAYVFFKCKTLGLRFKYTNKVSVTFKSPTSLGDYFNQNLRFAKSYTQCVRDYGKVTVANEYEIPVRRKLKLILKAFVTNPILLSASGIVYFSALIIGKFKKLGVNPQLYSLAKSTKEVQ